MCFHRYTSHMCGHTGVSIEKCTPEHNPIFCDRYHTLRTSSFRPCGGDYCKEDKETANWVKNGMSLLATCDYELYDLKQKIEDCHRELKSLDSYQKSWFPFQGDQRKKVESMHQTYQGLVEAFSSARERRKFITSGISSTKRKLEETRKRIALVLMKVQSSQAVAKDSSTQMVRQPATQASLQALPILSQVTMPKHVEGPATASSPPAPHTPLRKPSGLNSSRTLAVASTAREELASVLASMKAKHFGTPQSGPSAHASMPSVSQDQSAEAKVLPGVKKRGRPRKVKQPETPAPSHQLFPFGSSGEFLPGGSGSFSPEVESHLTKNEPSSGPRSKRRVNQKQSKASGTPSSGTRRSSRISSQKKVTYAEVSTSSSSEPPSPEPSTSASVTAFDAVSGSSAKATRHKKSTIQASQKADEEDKDYLSEDDAKGGDDSDAEGVVDEERQQDTGLDQVDLMDLDIMPMSNPRSEKKRVAAVSLKPTRASKRQAIVSYDTPKVQETDDILGLSGIERSMAYAPTPTGSLPSDANRFRPNTKTTTKQPGIPARTSWARYEPTTPTPTYTPLPASGGSIDFSLMDLEGHEVTPGCGISPLHHLHTMNQLAAGGNNLLDGDDVYDFDVGAMSQAVPETDDKT